MSSIATEMVRLNSVKTRGLQIDRFDRESLYVTSVAQFYPLQRRVIFYKLHRLFGMDSYNSPTTKPIFRASQVIWYILVLFEVVLILRFFLKLLGANPVASFTNFIYNISSPLVAPFQAVFSVSSIEKNIFEWTTLLAMFIYWIIAVGIMQLLFMSKTVSTPEAAQMLEQEEV